MAENWEPDVDDVDEETDEEELDEDGEPSELAKEFEAACKSAHSQIQVHIKAATDELNKAIALADKLGIPFYSEVSFLGNSYCPKNFAKGKFGKLDTDEASEIAQLYGEYVSDLFGEYVSDLLSDNYGGWVHSTVC